MLNKGKDIIEKKKKITSIIFIRACCCIGIVIFHYFCHSKGNFKFLHHTANSPFGFMFVTSFFSISGFVLYYNYPKVQKIKTFYYKRWKSILLPYYICFFYFFLRIAFIHRKLFYKGSWPNIFISLIGLDGYLSYKIKTYYLIGEWFLGALIIIYFLYPIITLIVNRNNIAINIIIICFFYFLMYKENFFTISKEINIITCLSSFYFGIESIRFKKFFLGNKIVFIFSLSLFIFLYFIKIKIKFHLLIHQIQGFSLFILLYRIGNSVMLTNANAVFIEISNLSYSIYLFHHRIIYDILSLNNPTEWYSHILLLSVTIILTIICSKIHLMVVNSIINSYILKKIDSIFI